MKKNSILTVYLLISALLLLSKATTETGQTDGTEGTLFSSTTTTIQAETNNGQQETGQTDGTEGTLISSTTTTIQAETNNGQQETEQTDDATSTTTIITTTTTTTTTTTPTTTSTTKAKGNCNDGYYPDENDECRFDFDRLSKVANIKIVTKKMDSNALQNEISSKCFLICPENMDCTALTGSVEWIYSEANTTSTTDLSYSTEKREFYSYLGDRTWESALGNSIMCTIKLNDTNTTFEAISTKFDLSFKCEMEGLTSDEISKSNPSQLEYLITLNEKETTKKRLKCTSTIPFACSDTSSSNCDFRLALNYNSAPSNDRVVVSQCSENSNGRQVCNPKERILTPSDAWNPSDNELIWDIAVNLESKNKNFKNENFELSLKNWTTGDVSPLFEKIELVKNLTVEFNYFSRPLSNFATCFNDPHCRTFDGKWFELQQAGEYLMYENVEAQTRVHVRSILCNPQSTSNYAPYCLNKIFIQYFYEVIRIDISKDIILYSDYSRSIIDQPISFDASGNVVNELNSLIIQKIGYGFDIVTGYGMVLRVYAFVWDFTLYINRYDIIPAKGDAGNINGLFSNWNGDKSDDLSKLKDGSNSNDLSAIYASYEASKNGIPSLETDFYPFNSTEIAYKHSFCSSLNIDLASSSDQRSPCANGRNEDAFGYQKKKSKRSTDSFDDPIEKLNRIGKSISFKKYLSMPAMPHAPKRFKRDDSNAEEKNATCDNLKTKVDSDLENGIDIDEVVNNCKLDTILDPGNDYTNGYKNDVSVSVIELATNDKENMDIDNGALVIKVTLTNLCPNNCTGNGNCTETGTCQCEGNYSGADCSLDPSEKPEIRDTTQTGIWDLSQGPLTDIIIRTKKFVSNNPNAKFKFSVYYPDINTLLTNGDITPTEIAFNTNFLNMTNITLNQNFFFLKISVTNDGSEFSDPITITAADLTKYTCTTSTCTQIVEDVSPSEANFQKATGIFVALFSIAGLYLRKF